ncbi:MAG: endonuclease/exonuclease/phosphatase family protein [Chloroflexota bacterium]
MAEIKVVTINLLSDLSRWEQRRPLLVEGLQTLAADVVALQEVKLPRNTAAELAQAAGYPHVYLTPKTGVERGQEGIALLSRRPIIEQGWLDLVYQQRVAQYIRVELDGQAVVVANGHFFWQPGESAPRLKQVERVLGWLHGLPGEPPFIVCGDFNSTPETRPVLRMLQDTQSAFMAVHGHEPEFTSPTPLRRSPWAVTKTLLGFFVLLRPRYLNLRWKGVLDYIFVDQRLRVLDCQVALNTPAAHDPRLYPSDHFGLVARVEG